jgi:hypothetical protein
MLDGPRERRFGPRFLAPWGYVLNGEVEWQGEDEEDTGKILVVDNSVEVV